MTFDPFGDYETCGYLRNAVGEKDLGVVKDLENASFILHIDEAVHELANQDINYETFKHTHKRLFDVFYPWAGQDRAELAPDIAITKGGFNKMFSHPLDVERASEYALRDINKETFSAGTCFAELAYAHPFLDGNGRTILTLHSEIMRRNHEHVEWERTDKREFLKALTIDLNNPGQRHFEKYLNPYIKDNALTLEDIGKRLKEFSTSSI